MAINNVVLVGRLTAAPEVKQTMSQIAVCSFTVAVDRAYKSGEDRQADFAKQYLMMTVICLNESEGFGAKRLTRFLDTLNALTQGEAPQDEEFWEHAELRCKQLGLREYFGI